MPTQYKLLALDVDGTLVARDNLVPADVADAVDRAQRSGLNVCLATGRSYLETAPVWRQLPMASPCQPMVLIGGALVSEADTGRTLYQKTIQRQVAFEYADALAEEGHACLAIVDPWRWGVDYYYSTAGDGQAVTDGWFAKMDVKALRFDRLSQAPDMPNPLRMHALVEPQLLQPLAERMKQRFAGRLEIHAILAPNYGVYIVEAFAAGVSKWQALKYLAQAERIGPAQIVAVGDDVNDLEMLSAAGMGAAVSHAPQHVKDAARHVLSGSLAEFIIELSHGRFDA